MKKNFCSPHLWQGYKKILRIMKLSIAMNLIFAITTLANSYSQTSSFTLNMSDVTVKDVIKTIEASSNYRFFYNDELSDISRKVDVNFHETGISDVLNSLFNNTGITYKVFENDLIVIAPKSSIQQMKITGTVTDGATGESLPGVNILIEGTSTGSSPTMQANTPWKCPQATPYSCFPMLAIILNGLRSAGEVLLTLRLFQISRTWKKW